MPAIFNVGEMLQQARQVYLVDTLVGEIFTDEVLLPFAAMAFDEMNVKLARVGHQVTEKVDATLTVPRLTIQIEGPEDILEPISLEERSLGSTNEDDWRPMVRERNLASGQPTENLGAWDYTASSFLFRSATTDRQIKLRYIRFIITKGLTSLVTVKFYCKTYISARIAALAAGHIGGNPDKAAYIMLDANAALDDMIGLWANAEQNAPVRRKPFRR